MRRDAPAVSKLGKGFYTNPAGEAVTEAGGKRGRSPMSAERKTGMHRAVLRGDRPQRCGLGHVACDQSGRAIDIDASSTAAGGEDACFGVHCAEHPNGQVRDVRKKATTAPFGSDGTSVPGCVSVSVFSKAGTKSYRVIEYS